MTSSHGVGGLPAQELRESPTGAAWEPQIIIGPRFPLGDDLMEGTCLYVHAIRSSIALERSGNVVGIIYVTLDDQAFPDELWSDSVLRVVTAWLDSLADLCGGRRDVILDFYDGPYEVRVGWAEDGILWVAGYRRGLEREVRLFSGAVPFHKLVEDLLAIADMLVAFCLEHRSEVDGLSDLLRSRHRVELLR